MKTGAMRKAGGPEKIGLDVVVMRGHAEIVKK